MSRYKTGHKQPRFRYSVLARCVAWANISVQVLFPLAVTFTPVMAARAQHAVQPRLSMGNTTVTADNNVEKNVASFAANAGTFLSSQPDSDATRNFITGMATAKANQEIQEWLGKYGTARVKLNVDKDFSLKDSSLEMLYPIYDTPTNMLFTQGAIHRTDDRTQSNIGFGWRHFSGNDWMAGVNTFIDHDLSRSHTRIGVGAEYWRDYLKLSANGYIRASGWKKSPDIEDYQERPANGWDTYGNPLQGQNVTLTLPKGVTSKTGNTVTTDAAGKADIELMSTVAGEHSITASVNNAQKTVTVKFKADFSTGQASLEVDSAAPKVANGKDAFTLTATVEDKNGNPVPGSLVTFNLPRGVKPLTGDNVWVKANGVGKAELQVVSVTAGTYEITASAGNSQPSNTQTITFVADKATATVSGIEVIGNYALADGKAKQTYKVTVTDANNNLLKDSEVTLTASPASLNLEPNGTATTNEQGQAIFTATTTVAATYTLKAQVSQTNGQVSTKTAESKFVADDKNAVLTASSDMQSLVADGKSTAKLEVTLMSANNPVGGNMWVDIQTPEGVTEKDYQFLPSKNDHFVSGKITRKFSTSKPGVYTFTFNALTYGGYEMKPVTVTIT
ncbi:inverse autotransporter beta domain-containing protein, partial [Escherichia sp. KCJ4928]